MTESVKWATYIDALSSAIRLRSIQRGKKEVEAMLESADADGTEDEDDDELASRLSPYDEGPAPSVAHIAAIEGTDESPSLVLNGDDEIPRSPRNKASQVSVGTATTAGDEFFESCVPSLFLPHARRTLLTSLRRTATLIPLLLDLSPTIPVLSLCFPSFLLSSGIPSLFFIPRNVPCLDAPHSSLFLAVGASSRL